jgi:hypothetical protein
MMNLGADKVTTGRKDIEQVELRGTTRGNPNTRNHS